MKYIKDKVEAIKILVSEIINLNEKLPADREVELKISGGTYPQIEVVFWHPDEYGDPDFGDGDLFSIYLTDEDWHKEDESSFAKISKKMKAWEEEYCNE